MCFPPTSQKSLEEDDTLEIAWECLETARVIYSRVLPTIADPAARTSLRSELAFTYLRLGDLAMESDKFLESIEDFKQCLEIRLADNPRPPKSRHLAEVYLQMALAYSQAAGKDQLPNDEVSCSCACVCFAIVD